MCYSVTCCTVASVGVRHSPVTSRHLTSMSAAWAAPPVRQRADDSWLRYREQETQLSLTNRATHLCECNSVADCDPNTHLPICVAEFCRTALKGVQGIKYKRTPKIGEPA